MKIKYLDLKAINQSIDINKCINDVIDNGQYLLGEKTKSFEQSWKQYCGTEHCITCNSGLDALTLILKAYNFPKHSEIIVPANTFIATILAITNCGYKPILVEPISGEYTIDPDQIKQHINNRTRAVIVTHLYGYVCDMDAINCLKNKYNIKIIEDAAQAHMAQYNDKKVGSLGDAAAFSFYPSKNLGALGDAGAITTNDSALAQKIACLKNYGFSQKYISDLCGINSRMDEFQASILLEKVKNIQHENNKRQEIAKYYLNNIKNQFIQLPPYKDNCVWHIFPIHTFGREKLQEYLLQNNIETVIHYPMPPHKQKSYSYMNQLSFPITEYIHNTELSLPCNSSLTKEEIQYIVSIINNWQP